MSEKEKKDLRDKANDYQTYSVVLLALSALLYLGTIIPGALAAEQKPFVLIIVGLFLGVSLYFLNRSFTYVRVLKDEDDSMTL
ncbi:YrhC-like protein [Thermolongibacillus altinsuensis]|jgi:membrane protein YqaA with SNARE-associated domain|uniref:YrhC-like protein n=1 Tax=Thermolongibacillus altinsuensis TaxID=575256 RepID=A0A4R1QPD7_9BACL|nr:YrhC family protein [Thermolongibacillus altinsuensis]TCL52007.1 YrhC-like protein [Thermolongibacillus altinsuensis]